MLSSEVMKGDVGPNSVLHCLWHRVCTQTQECTCLTKEGNEPEPGKSTSKQTGKLPNASCKISVPAREEKLTQLPGRDVGWKSTHWTGTRLSITLLSEAEDHLVPRKCPFLWRWLRINRPLGSSGLSAVSFEMHALWWYSAVQVKMSRVSKCFPDISRAE